MTGKAIKAMWALMFVAQFLAFIGVWQIAYPDLLRITLYEVKRIILAEFFDDLAFS